MADVHKHALLAWMLDYMIQKPKPLSYLETHAGRAVYDLRSPEAVKTGEAAQGIALAQGWFAKDHPYARALAKSRERHGPHIYPGSPQIALDTLRFEDNVTLAELHPAEAEALRVALPSWIGLTLGVMKDSALVLWLGIIELLRASQIIVTRLQEPMLILLIAGAIYFAISFPIARLGGHLERKWQEND